MKKIDAWHFVADDGQLANGWNLSVAPGYIYSEDSPIVICESGLHASRKAFDALRYAPGAMLCRVKVWGDVSEQADKLVGCHREVLQVIDITKELRLFGCWCVRNTPISGGRTTWDLLKDERSRNAVFVAERFAEGSAPKKELAAAWAAARGAASAAAWAAARGAAWAAASAAARGAAWDAAWDAAWAFQSNELERRMLELFSKETA
jgi:hypothetical protein